MSQSTDFEQSLKKMLAIHESKRQDYANPDNVFSNFDVQEYLSKQFKNDRDKVFATMVAVKLARLATLLSKEGKPNNESIEDTFIDAANYLLIWKADFVNRLPPYCFHDERPSLDGTVWCVKCGKRVE